MSNTEPIKAKSTSRKITITCRLDTPFLGDLHSRDRILRFDTSTDSDGTVWLHTNMAQWRWALKEAMDSMGILAESNIDYVRLPVKIKAPTVRLYSRRRSSRDGKAPDTHQCFQAGTVITFSVFLLTNLEESGGCSELFNQRPPTEEELVECFKVIGECIGLSPWGSKTGFGRFTVE